MAKRACRPIGHTSLSARQGPAICLAGGDQNCVRRGTTIPQAGLSGIADHVMNDDQPRVALQAGDSDNPVERTTSAFAAAWIVDDGLRLWMWQPEMADGMDAEGRCKSSDVQVRTDQINEANLRGGPVGRRQLPDHYLLGYV
jgi:hypothetical protein